MPKNNALLREIKENFAYAVDYWREIREEGARDMQFIAGNPWDPQERKAREDAHRPCISLDELNQYVNQLINDVRVNKRSVRVAPAGSGADDRSAELRANIIRGIEYKSNAQAAYRTAFEGAAQRSYGFARISKRYVSDDSDEMDQVIKRIPNQDSVYIDPEFREADASDIGWAFIVDQLRKGKFLKQWPNAEIRDFSTELLTQFPHWLNENSVQVAEYWRMETERRVRHTLQDGRRVYDDELQGEKLDPRNVAHSRRVESKRVRQYITNGVEILEENDWDGKYIPIGTVYGKELYVDDGGGAKRVWMSLVRMARDPQMLYNYYRTCEMELAGMVPKTPVIGYEGQFEGHEDEWAAIGRAPIAYLQVKPVIDATGSAVLPLPQWNRWEPPIQAYEIGAEAARRAIQSAVGMYNTSVGKHDTNAQSGIAIRELDQQSSQGSFHFIDNYDGFLAHMGRMIDDLLDKTYDTVRDVAIRKLDEQHGMVHLNEPHLDPQTKEPAHYRLDQGVHDVTITTGPSSDSQRAEAQDFMGALAQNEAIFPRIADLVVRLRNLGPIGDEIAKRLTPPDIAQQEAGGQQVPPQVQQAMQMLGQQHDALVAEVNRLTEEIKTKAVEMQSREKIEFAKIQSAERIAEMQESTKREIAIAQLDANTGLKVLEADLAAVKHQVELLHAAEESDITRQQEQDLAEQDRMHQAGMAQMQQGHEQQMTAQQRDHQAQMQDAQQMHQAALQDSQQQAQADLAERALQNQPGEEDRPPAA